MAIVVWRLMAHHQPACRLPMIRWAIANNRIAIGWGDVGNLAQAIYAAPENIQEAVQAHFLGQGPPGNVPSAGIQLWNFRGGAECHFYPNVADGPDQDRYAMQCGDLVILKTDDEHGGWPQSVVMQIGGPNEHAHEYEYIGAVQAPFFDYQHQRNAAEVAIDPQILWQEAGGLGGVRALHQNIHNALVRCQFPVEYVDGQIWHINDV